jgi:hypothetical protein
VNDCNMDSGLKIYPGGDLVAKGLQDLRNATLTEEALLVLIARPRLAALGIDVPERADLTRPLEHRLFDALESRLGNGAHSAYNALIRRIVSFANAYSEDSHQAQTSG